MERHPLNALILLQASMLLVPALAGQTRSLALSEAVALALSNNPELAIERTRRDGAVAALKTSRGAFDPTLRRVARNPAASILEGANGQVYIREWRPEAVLRQRLPWAGISWDAGFDASRTSTTNPFSTLNRQRDLQ